MFNPVKSFRQFRVAAFVIQAALMALVPASGLLSASKAVWADPGSATAPEEKNAHLWKPQTKSVAVFKEGMGFFMREGDVSLRDGWCVAEQIPPAAFGTLAIFSCDEKSVVDIVGSGPGEVVEFDGRDAPKSMEAKRVRLEASKNLRIQLYYKQKGQDRNATGKLISVGTEYVVLESDSNSFAVPLDGITKMQVLELPLRIHVSAEKTDKAAEKTAAPAKAEAAKTEASKEEPGKKSTLAMAYLRQGITWVPDYSLKIIDEENAELTLRGSIINEAEDLVHTDVHLVVGVPHFVHADRLAPLAVGQVIRAVGSAVSASNGGFSNMKVTGQMLSNSITVSNYDINNPPAPASSAVKEVPVTNPGADMSAVMANVPPMGGAAAADYTVYTKKDMTLRRGEKAIVTLFTKKIKYSHSYRWQLPEKMEHFLLLHNLTDTAWTTGPCLALSDDRPLSEDLLKYTPKGADGELPVTAAINIGQQKEEKEINRQLKAHSPTEKVFYDLVTLEGTLKLHNFEKREVEITIKVPTPGKPTKADNKGVVSVDPTKLKLLDRVGTVEWTVKLKPGEDKTLTYEYEKYVPSN
jgi:hypothetical protein